MKNFKISEITILDMEEVKKLTGLDIDTIEQLVWEGNFPKSIYVCGQDCGWSEKEVHEWIWVQAIQMSWSKDSPTLGVSYSTLRNAENVLGLNSEFVSQISAEIRNLNCGEDRANDDLFGDV